MTRDQEERTQQKMVDLGCLRPCSIPTPPRPPPHPHGVRERKQKRAGREKGGLELESVRLRWCKLGREGHERRGSFPTLHSLTLLASLGGLFLWGTLPARLNWLPAWLQ